MIFGLSLRGLGAAGLTGTAMTDLVGSNTRTARYRSDDSSSGSPDPAGGVTWPHRDRRDHDVVCKRGLVDADISDFTTDAMKFVRSMLAHVGVTIAPAIG